MQVAPRCAKIYKHIENVGLEKDLEEAVCEIFWSQWDKLLSPLHYAACLLEPQSRSAADGYKVMHGLSC